jgi:hypothetical protein
MSWVLYAAQVQELASNQASAAMIGCCRDECRVEGDLDPLTPGFYCG